MTVNKNQVSLKGSIVALVTPMLSAAPYNVDYEALNKLIDWHVECGTNGIVLLGTTGEGPTITETEYIEIMKRVVHKIKSEKKSEMPIIAGSGTNSTSTTIKKTLLAKTLGADAALVVVPYYNKPTQQGLYEHFKQVSENVENFPLILYNVPSRTGCDMLPETVAKLSQISNIIGIKESSGSLDRFAKLSQMCSSDFTILSGDDHTVIPAILSGSKVEGVISVTANVLPKLVKAACEAAFLNNKEKATEIDNALKPFHATLFLEPNPVPTKYLLNKMKKIQEGIRLPLLPLSESLHTKVAEAYETVKDISV